MNSKTYIAITIGPIYKTFYEAKRTRAVWAASYFFSWFMRTILERCKEKGMNIFLPYTDHIYKESKYGAGLYADRLYFEKNEKTTIVQIQKIIDDILTFAETESTGALNKTFLQQYLNLHVIEKEITKNDLEKNYSLALVNAALDNIELKQNFAFVIEKNPIQEYIINKAGSETFLARDAFGSGNKERKFRSIPEIATTTLQRQNKDLYEKCLHKEFRKNNRKVTNEDVEFIDILNENGFSEHLRPHHKYYAVLYADGDNVGKLLQEIESKKIDITLFSKELFKFGINAAELISAYGGNAIYLGGEDILAFLPTVCVEEQNINYTHSLFSLINLLDKCFNETVVKFAHDNNLTAPSLSYGIMLSYIKYPLKESLQKAHDLLGMAKECVCKNSIALRFQKHSGQYTECFIEKSKTCSTQEIYLLVEQYASNLSLETNEVLSSIIQKFKDELFFTLFFEAAKSKRLDAFFENYFNEDIHKTGAKNDFLRSVRSFSEKIINDYPNKQDCKNLIFTILRFIHFVNTKRD